MAGEVDLPPLRAPPPALANAVVQQWLGKEQGEGWWR